MANVWMRFPEGKAKALTLSYDDGVEQDKKLMDILDDAQIKCTFNLNSGLFAPEGTVYPAGQIHRRLSQDAVVELYGNTGHEVAVHCLTHPHLENLPPAAVAREVVQDRENLEMLFGVPVCGMAYPYGTYNDRVVRVLEDCGIAYARTVETTGTFALPSGWLRLKATCHHSDPQLQALAQKFTQQTPDGEPWLFYVWGHSYEFERDGNWDVMETFAKAVGGRNDVWYATNSGIYAYVKAYERLVFAADLSLVQNPSAQTVWFLIDQELHCVQPGETKRL